MNLKDLKNVKNNLKNLQDKQSINLKKSFYEKNKKAFNSYLRTKTKSRAGVGSDFLANDPTTIQVSINQQVFGEPVSSVNISKR